MTGLKEQHNYPTKGLEVPLLKGKVPIKNVLVKGRRVNQFTPNGSSPALLVPRESGDCSEEGNHGIKIAIFHFSLG